jgi:dipeptidyl aminopeptidase/acylaminoacyl peptidase
MLNPITSILESQNGIVGPSSLVTFLENTDSYRRGLRESEYGGLEHDLELLERISPINHMDKIRASLLIVHGANGPRTPLGEALQVDDAVQVHEALQARGMPVELLVSHDEGHSLAKLENRLDAYPKIADFWSGTCRSEPSRVWKAFGLWAAFLF